MVMTVCAEVFMVHIRWLCSLLMLVITVQFHVLVILLCIVVEAICWQCTAQELNTMVCLVQLTVYNEANLYFNKNTVNHPLHPSLPPPNEHGWHYVNLYTDQRSCL